MRGQALLEFLILLPVILLLFLATAEIAKLFAISGKSEVAARYLALRNFRGGPYDLRETVQGPGFPDPLDPATTAENVNDIFFEGSLTDGDSDPLDTGYYEFIPGEVGIFNYTPPDLGSNFWTIITRYFDPGEHLFPIRGHRVTYLYDLPFFPYKEMDDIREWGDDDGADPLGPYDLYTAKGDFVVLTDTFSGNTQTFLELVEATGLIYLIPQGLVSAGIALIIFFLLQG
jgi:hypothetical protein